MTETRKEGKTIRLCSICEQRYEVREGQQDSGVCPYCRDHRSNGEHIDALLDSLAVELNKAQPHSDAYKIDCLMRTNRTLLKVCRELLKRTRSKAEHLQ